MTAVHQFVPALLPWDATGDHTLALRDALRSAGWESDIYVEAAHDDLWRHAVYFERYPDRAKPGDVLLYQLSTASPVAEFLMGRPETLVLDYHNITPSSFYEGWEDHTSEKVALARVQAAALAPMATLGIADSAFNAADLRRIGCPATAVVPILVDMEERRRRPTRPSRPASPATRPGHRAAVRRPALAEQGPAPSGRGALAVPAVVRPRRPPPLGGARDDRVLCRGGVRLGR